MIGPLCRRSELPEQWRLAGWTTLRGVGGLTLARRHPLGAGRTAAKWQLRIWRGVVGVVWLGARKLRAWRHDTVAQQAIANQQHSNDRAIGAASATHL